MRRLAFLVVTLLLTFSGLVGAAPEKVLFWTPWGPPNATWWQQLVDDFNASQDLYEVELYTAPGGDAGAYERFLVAASAGAGPDVIHFGFDFAARLVENNMLQPLDPFIARDGFSLDEYMPGLIELGRHDGALYALPFMGIFRGAYLYNADQFSAMGFDADQPPTQWDSFVDLAKKFTLRSSDGTFERAGTHFPWDGFNAYITFFWMLQSAGGSVYNDETGQVTFNSAEGYEALQMLRDLVWEHEVVSPQIASNGPNIASGRLGTALQTSGSLGVYKQQAGDNANAIRLSLPLQKDADSPRGTWGGGHTFLLPKSSSNVEGAWAWIKFMARQENAVKWAQLTSQSPVRRDVMFEFLEYVDDPFSWGNILEGLNSINGVAQSFELKYPAIPQEIIAPFVRDAINNNRTVQDALEQAANRVALEIGTDR